MKVESRIFEIVTVFFFVVGIVYAVLGAGSRSASPGCSSPAACH